MKLHYGRLFQDRLDGTHGLPRAALGALVSRFPEVQAEVRRRRREGEYGFLALGRQDAVGPYGPLPQLRDDPAG